MARFEADGPKSPAWRVSGSRDWSARRHIGVPGALFVFCSLFAVVQCRAQDVAEAARQERARKSKQQKQSKHVYTEDDLARQTILTPGDRAQVQAKQDQQASPTPEKTQETIEVQSLPPDAPLGDVARHYRKQKQAHRQQQSAEFHLPFADAPLAAPKPEVLPAVRPPANRPSLAAPWMYPRKRSPFERPSITRPPVTRVPTNPPSIARRSIDPSPSSASVLPRVAAVQPAPRVSLSELPSWHRITVRRGDSLWKLAKKNLGQGLRWHDLLAANPSIHNPNRIVQGAQMYVPARAPVPPSTSRIKVQRGDTLWKIAQTQLGHASYAACIAHANPAIRDANLIYAGQVLILPAGCAP